MDGMTVNDLGDGYPAIGPCVEDIPAKDNKHIFKLNRQQANINRYRKNTLIDSKYTEIENNVNVCNYNDN